MSNGRITNAEIRSEQDLIDLGADRTYLPHSSKIYIEKTGIEQRLDEYLVKNNFVATRNPDEFDDSTQNFEVGSRWVNSITEKIFTMVNDSASGAVWTQGGGGVVTFVTIVEAEAREDNAEYDLIYVVENESIYSYSTSGLSAETVDGFYLLGDDNVPDGRWRGLAGRYIFKSLIGINDAVVGTSAQVSQGIATHSFIQQAHDDISSDGGRIFLITSVTESVTWDKHNITLEGKGRSTSIVGTINLSGSGNTLKQFKIMGDVDIVGDINYISETWVASSYAVNVSGSGNYTNYIQET